MPGSPPHFFLDQNLVNWIPSRRTIYYTPKTGKLKLYPSSLLATKQLPALTKTKVNDNGINFLPECKDACFIGKKNVGCSHRRTNAQINKVGDYFLFPLQCWHHGYFNDESNKNFIAAQLFVRPTINEDTEHFSCSCNEGQQEFITGRLDKSVGEYTILKDLSVDLLENWGTTYSATDFPPSNGVWENAY